MISIKKLLLEVLLVEVSFKDLLAMTDSKRKERGSPSHVRSRSKGVRQLSGDAESTNEAWIFRYKSIGNHSRTGHAFEGKIIFLKESVNPEDNAIDLDCKVHCTCPDYFYRRQEPNYRMGAGTMDPRKGIFVGEPKTVAHNGEPPTHARTTIGPGLCKHLVSLVEYLKTSIAAPKPTSSVPPPLVSAPLVSTPTSTPIAYKPTMGKETPIMPPPTVGKAPTLNAPTPEDKPEGDEEDSDYSDSRIDENTDKQNVIQQMDALVAKNKTFQLTYEA